VNDADLTRERLAVLVHEVRSPVAAVSAIAEAVLDQGLDTLSRRELASLVISACRSIERIVADPSLVSIHFGDVDVASLLRAVVAAASLGGGRVVARIPDDLPHVEGDAVRLHQALDNLVRNALVHGGSEGEVVVSAAAAGRCLSISVADSGAGIPFADQQRVFDPGVKLEASRPGSGLGLGVTRGIVESHGGTIAVTSTPGTGSTFTVALPLRRL